ncbi:MAG: SRPBCC domain-containing protein [Anaerolineaceae bacterium]
MQQTTQKVSDMTIVRVFNARPELVWKMWSDCGLLMRWWGPKDYTSPKCRMDFRVGGKYVFTMHSPVEQGDQDLYSTGTYKKIDPHKELVFTDSFSDENGNVVPGSYYGMGDDFPLELLVTIRFDDQGGKTRMTLTHSGMPEGEMREMTGVGWNQSFDKFEHALMSR